MTESTNTASEFVRDLGDAARKNPISAALIGMGVLWLFGSGARRTASDSFSAVGEAMGDSGMRSGLRSVGNRTSSVAQDVRDRFLRAGERAGDTLDSTTSAIRERGASVYEETSRLGSEFTESASDFASSIPDTASDLLDTARSNLAAMFREQPLLLGAVGIAIGAGIAASLPSTELEAEYFGETSDHFKDHAQEIAADQADRAKTIARNVASAAAHEAGRQGLTPDELKAAAVDLGGKVKTVVSAAARSLKDRVG
jgi:hypothetical protein